MRKIFVATYSLFFISWVHAIDSESLVSFRDLEKGIILSLAKAPPFNAEEPYSGNCKNPFNESKIPCVQEYLKKLSNKSILGENCLSYEEIAEILRSDKQTIFSFVENGEYSLPVCRQLRWYYGLNFSSREKIPLSDFKKCLWDGSEGALTPKEMDEILSSKSANKSLLLPRKAKMVENILNYLRNLISISDIDTVSHVLLSSSRTLWATKALEGDEEACHKVYLACRDYYRTYKKPLSLKLLETRLLETRIEPTKSIWDTLTSCFSAGTGAATDRSKAYRADKTEIGGEAAALLPKKKRV